MPDELFGTLDWDATPAKETITEVNEQVEKTLEKVKNLKKEQKKSFNEVMGMMRASYMMVSGLSQVLGGSLPQVFSSMFSVAISTIATYKAIAAAMAASGVGTIQAIVMFASLITALFNLSAAMTGQTELSDRIGGLNTTIHGISSIIGSLNFL